MTLIKKIFIDGEAGTTGLQLRERIAGHPALATITIDPARRKDAGARLDAMREADAVILCLPDDAARQAVALADDNNLPCVIIDASTAHRVDPDWVYGFPELCPGQREKIAASKRIANTGCYAAAMIAMIRPLVDAGLLAADTQLTIPAISGYSGGGKALIETMAKRESGKHFLYALDLNHKHIPEVMAHGGITTPPIFMPSVGDFACGMIVQLPLAAGDVQGGRDDVHAAYAEHYAGEQFIRLNDKTALSDEGHLMADALNGTNMLEIAVFGDDARMVITARLDNLGKGAAGAALQNCNIALGLDESLGL